jgi:hypothetical protein
MSDPRAGNDRWDYGDEPQRRIPNRVMNRDPRAGNDRWADEEETHPRAAEPGHHPMINVGPGVNWVPADEVPEEPQ